MLPKAVVKYLRSYAEATATSALPEGLLFRTAVVVPLAAEEPEALDSWLASWRELDEPRLLVLVVNERLDAEDGVRVANRRLIDAVEREFGPRVPDDAGVSFFVDAERSGAVALIRRVGPVFGLGPKEGVGRARKLGFDLTLGLWASGHLISPWVGSGDADAAWNSSHWRLLERQDHEASAWLLPYWHAPSGSPELDASMAALECSFRYYVLGLEFAGSPYAFHALGSAIAVRLDAYAQARGVPNRQAGEDFYLLSKLSKLRPLRRVHTPPVVIRTRLSSRVPFGTGPSLLDCIEHRRSRPEDDSYGARTYDPRVFVALRCFSSDVCRHAEVEERVAPISHFEGLTLEPDVRARIASQAQEFVAGIASELARCPSAGHRLERVHERWDGLSTLRFIHRLTDDYYPRLSLREALERAGLATRAQPLELVRQQLRSFEEALATCIGPSALR